MSPHSLPLVLWVPGGLSFQDTESVLLVIDFFFPREGHYYEHCVPVWSTDMLMAVKKGITTSSWPLCLCVCDSPCPNYPPFPIISFSHCLVHLSVSRWSATCFIKPSLTALDSTNLSTLYIVLPIQASLDQVPNTYLVFQIPVLTVKWFQAYSFDFIRWTVGVLEAVAMLHIPFTTSISCSKKYLLIDRLIDWVGLD